MSILCRSMIATDPERGDCLIDSRLLLLLHSYTMFRSMEIIASDLLIK